MTRQVALLRGVNVGPSRALAMDDLRVAVEGLGAEDVRTHLRSGNVVYRTSDRPERMVIRLREALGAVVGFDIDVVVRTAEAMRSVIDANPFTDEAARDPSRLQVVFLAAAPPPGAVDGIEQEDLREDRVRVGAREIYVWAPGGVARSPGLAALGRRRLQVPSTARNWRTVQRLAAMVDV